MNEFLDKIQEYTESLIKELKWDEKEVESLVNVVNKSFEKKLNASNGGNEPDNSLVVHPGNYSGGFVLFGGWTTIYDHVIPAGTLGHELYLAFGGLGVGGWSGDCDIELITDGTFEYEGVSYVKPKYYDKEKEGWEAYNTGFKWFHENVKSFAFMYLPVFLQPIPVFAYFDKNSNRIGISVPSCSISIGVGGGSVTVKS